MISTAFDYKQAKSIDEAIQALGEDAKLLAGGHSLIPALKLRLNQTGTLVDISQIPALKDIRLDGSTLVIGACATHTEIAESADVRKHAPLLSQTAEHIGDVQVRNAGTIGGSLAHADPAADWPAALLAAGAVVKVKGKDGERDVAISDFFAGIYTTVLGEDELIVDIRVPSMEGKAAQYVKFAQPASRFALVGCAVVADVSSGNYDQISVAFTGMADTPYRDEKVMGSLEGEPLGQESIQAAIANLDTSVYIMSDHYADEEYRKHLAGVMLGRALKALG